jgi:hypothetical protein
MRTILIAKSFFLLTPHPTLSHKGRGELEEKTFGKRYNLVKNMKFLTTLKMTMLIAGRF